MKVAVACSGNDSGSDRGAVEHGGPAAGAASSGTVCECIGSSDGGVGAGGVEALCVAGGAVAERERGVHEVAVAVGDDGRDRPDPARLRRAVNGRLAEPTNPRVSSRDGSFGKVQGPGFDEVAALVESRVHLFGHGADGFGNEAGDQTGQPAGSSSGGAGGEAQPVEQDRANVVGVGQRATCDHVGEHLLEVVVVGLGSAQLSGERAEGVGLDDGLGMLEGESAAAYEVCPSVMLGGCGDGLVLGNELGDGREAVLLGLDGLVR